MLYILKRDRPLHHGEPAYVAGHRLKPTRPYTHDLGQARVYQSERAARAEKTPDERIVRIEPSGQLVMC